MPAALAPRFSDRSFQRPSSLSPDLRRPSRAADRESRTAGPDEGVKVQTSAHALHGLRPTPGAPDMDAPAGLIPFADRLHAHAGLVVSFSSVPTCGKHRLL